MSSLPKLAPDHFYDLLEGLKGLFRLGKTHRCKLWYTIFVFMGFFPLFANPALNPSEEDKKGTVLRFKEIWGYVLDGREHEIAKTAELSDIAYFSAGVDRTGRLTKAPNPQKLKNHRARIHLVITLLSNQSLSHFTLHQEYGVRDRLIDEIVQAAGPFDGLQLDYEAVHRDDIPAFLEFVSLLRQRLPNKILSLALPARLNSAGDIFGYAHIARIVDRIILMAYDEHWSGSKPGPIATIGWGLKVSDYAQTQIPREKLVMGAPFYGRSWVNYNPASAHIHSTVERIKKEAGIQEVQRSIGIPWFTRTVNLKVTTWYEDAESNRIRLKAYRDSGVHNIAFWRIGQEDMAIWDKIGLE